MLDFIKIEFGLLTAQKRKVRIYIFLHLSKGKKLISPLPLFINPSFWQGKDERVSPRYKEAENHELLAENIIDLYQTNKVDRKNFSQNAIYYFKKNFEKEKLLLELEEILK